MQPTSNKTVSVIVPCFNYAHYIEETLDSVLNQTYPIHEIIVVDDGGTDNCKEVVSQYPNVYYLRKENGGLSSARNAGIKIATGEYIMCLDADDKLTPAAVEEHMKIIDGDKAIAQCALMEFGERYAVMVPTITEKENQLQRIMQSNTVFCNAMFPRQAWVDVGGYDESATIRLGYEDWLFWIECLEKGYYINTSDFIALRYRAHEGQMTQATSHPNAQKLYKYIMDKHAELYSKYNLKIAGSE